MSSFELYGIQRELENLRYRIQQLEKDVKELQEVPIHDYEY